VFLQRFLFWHGVPFEVRTGFQPSQPFESTIVVIGLDNYMKFEKIKRLALTIDKSNECRGLKINTI